MLILLAKLIGLVVAGFGLTIFASPKFTQKVFAFIKEGRRIYWGGVIRCLVGLVLLIIASKSVLPVATVAVGLILLLSGIMVFACDLEKLRGFLAHYSELPVLVIRLLGLVAACFGILIFSIV
ncbi:MAG: hypothetical protein WC530_01515 [Candidatus Omnitrophota bacterium]|jgi:uncharacterized protein YjeT (DUF2065 family)